MKTFSTVLRVADLTGAPWDRWCGEAPTTAAMGITFLGVSSDGDSETWHVQASTRARARRKIDRELHRVGVAGIVTIESIDLVGETIETEGHRRQWAAEVCSAACDDWNDIESVERLSRIEAWLDAHPECVVGARVER